MLWDKAFALVFIRTKSSFNRATEKHSAAIINRHYHFYWLLGNSFALLTSSALKGQAHYSIFILKNTNQAKTWGKEWEPQELLHVSPVAKFGWWNETQHAADRLGYALLPGFPLFWELQLGTSTHQRKNIAKKGSRREREDLTLSSFTMYFITSARLEQSFLL